MENPSQARHSAMSDVMNSEDLRRNPLTGVMIAKIEEILIANLDALRENQPMSISLHCRSSGRVQIARFPSYRNGEARRFTAILQILHLSHEALIAGTVITKRAIYYQNPELFGSQRYVDNLVDDIAFTFGLGRDALNIVAASKGLIAGALSVKMNNGSTIHCNADDGQGVLIPEVRAITDVRPEAVVWLLVIEKEATFRGLVDSRFHETASVGPGVLVTAKGYPDLPTRQFLHKLHAAFPQLPMYALVDFDPDGISIMLTYKNGSRMLRHEENATLNRLQWIGPRSSDIVGCGSGDLPPSGPLNSRQLALPPPGPDKTTMPLKSRDRKLAVRLLTTTVEDDERIENMDYVRELQVMLLLNTKAEIQAVDEAGDLTAWLDRALTERMTI